MKTNPQHIVWVRISLASIMALAIVLLIGCGKAGPAAVDPTCERPLQDLIDAAAPGDVVTAAGGCVYREMVDINKPITLKAAPGGSEIRGSNVWDDAAWSKRDSTWLSRKTVPRLIVDSEWKCEPDTRQCRWPEQVFMNGRQLTQVVPATTPGPGQFAVNGGRKVILGENPIGKTVEVTVRNHWVVGVADVTDATDVTIDGFTMKHAASDGVLNSGNDDWTIKNGDYSYSHTSDVLIKRAKGALVSGNKIHHAGQKGVAGNEVDLKLEGNEIYANNTEGFNSSWNAGGVKISNPQTVTFAGNTVYDNRGNGLWLDVPTEDQDLVVRGNRVHHNDANGIRSEVTDDDVQIYDNVVWENGWARSGSKAAGISLNASHNNRVYNNVVAWNANGIRVINSLRSVVHPDEEEYDSVYNVEVDNNDILMDTPRDGAYALGWIMTNSDGNLYDPSANNRGHDNSYWYPAPEGSQKRYSWDVELSALGAFNDTPGEENARYLSDAEKDEVLAANGILNVSQPPDTTAPSVTITTPTEGASYAMDQTVDARYSCEDEDGGSGLTSCLGPVADGAPIDTGSTGSYDFTVTATDNAGNTNSLTQTYAVAGGSSSACTISGTPADDTISGTSEDDTICAGGGNDTIKGLAGNDTLRGGGGTDTLVGGDGDDTLTGGAGNDTERGGPGGDKLVGGGGADALYGQDGADTVHSKDGVAGNDRLDGGAGTDMKVTDATEKSIVGFP